MQKPWILLVLSSHYKYYKPRGCNSSARTIDESACFFFDSKTELDQERRNPRT